MLSNPELSSATDEPNVVLAPDEIATLGTLMSQYDRLLQDMDSLNARIEALLEQEAPAKEAPKGE